MGIRRRPPVRRDFDGFYHGLLQGQQLVGGRPILLGGYVVKTGCRHLHAGNVEFRFDAIDCGENRLQIGLGDEALNQGDMRRVLFVELKPLGTLLAHPRIPLRRLFQHFPVWLQQHVDSNEAVLSPH